MAETALNLETFLSNFLKAALPPVSVTFKDAGDPSRNVKASPHDPAVIEFAKTGKAAKAGCTASLAGKSAPGFVLTFEPGKRPAIPLKPSIILEHLDESKKPTGRLALVYRAHGDLSAIDALRKELEPQQGDSYTIGTDMPLPYADWGLHADSLDLLESGDRFPVHDYGVLLNGLMPELEGQEGEKADTATGLSSDNTPTSYLNGAEVYGEISDEVRNLPIKVSRAGKAMTDTFKTSAETTFGTFLTDSLSVHKEGKKDGPCFVSASLIDGKRNSNTVRACYMLGLDVDSGASIDTTFQRIRKLGLFAAVYTTHSHGTKRLTIQQDKFHKWAVKHGHAATPETDTVRRFLHDEGKYTTDVIDSACYVETIHDDRGMQVVAETRPIDKFRIIFPLATPYVIAEQNMAQRDALNAWREMVLGMGARLGISVDKAASDACRLFYLPRHAKGRPHRNIIIGGEPLDWRTIKHISVRDADKSSDPFAAAGDAMGGSTDSKSVKVGDLNLKAWAKHFAHACSIADIFETHAVERVRHDQGGGKLTIECPFDDYHSDAGNLEDKGCYVANPDDRGGFQFRCSHDACAGRDRLNMLAKAIGDRWFDASALTDRDFWLEDKGYEEALAALNPQSGKPITIDRDGALHFSKGAPFCRVEHHSAPWFGTWVAQGKDGFVDPVCQAFRVVAVASDRGGGGASLSLGFDTAFNGRQEVTISRAALSDRNEVPKLLAEKWFEMRDQGDMLDLLRLIILPIDTLLVDRTGWHDDAFLHPSGETIAARDADRKLRLQGGAASGDWSGGTLDGWTAAVAPAFHDDAHGREQFAFGVMAGCAGIIAGFVGLSGYPIINLHGSTSRGKSTSLKLAASASGAVGEKGAYQSLRKTDNGMEALLSARSGVTLAFDEGRTTRADTLSDIIWMMAHGGGKTRGTVTGEARVGREFCGFAMMANEVPLVQMMAQERKTQPGGFHARVCDVDVTGVGELMGGEKDRAFAAFALTRQHYGHAWRPVAQQLQSLAPEEVQSDLNLRARLLAGDGADSFSTRSAMALALVWLSGEIMQKLGLIPSCDLERVVRWAWGERASETTVDPFTRAMEQLLTAIQTRRGSDILEWGIVAGGKSDEPVARDITSFKTAAAWLYNDGSEEVVLVPKNNLADLCGGNMGMKALRDQMMKAGILKPSGVLNRKPRHSKLPDRSALSHFRVRVSELARFADD